MTTIIWLNESNFKNDIGEQLTGIAICVAIIVTLAIWWGDLS